MLYSSKIQPYKFVNPNLIKTPRFGMATAVKKSMGRDEGAEVKSTSASSPAKKTLLGFNRLGISLYSLGDIQRQIRDVITSEILVGENKKKFLLRKEQYLRDQKSEQQTEAQGKPTDVSENEDIKKEGKDKLGWLEKLLGPFKGIVEFAIRAILVQGVLRWISDPKNGERLSKIVNAATTFFGFVYNVVAFSIDQFMSGVSNIFGDGSKTGFARFAEVLGGLGQIILGIAAFKAAKYLLNPFSLVGDILGLLGNLFNRQPPGQPQVPGADVPGGQTGQPPKPQLGKGAQKIAENYGDDAARYYDDLVKRGKKPVDALKAVKGKFNKVPPKPKGLFANLKQGITGKLDDLKVAGHKTLESIKGGGQKALTLAEDLGKGVLKLGKGVLDKGRQLAEGAGGWISKQKDAVAKIAQLIKDPNALGKYVKNLVSNKIKPALESNPLVKKIIELAKNPKQIPQAAGGLIKNALASKQVKDLAKYLKEVKGNVKVGGLDTIIAALVALLEYGAMGTPFLNAFLGATGGLLGYSGGFALGAPFGGVPGFIAGAAGGIAGEYIGRQLARVLAKGPLGKVKDPIMKDGRMLADPYLAEGGIITKPTRAVIGERGPEAIIPLSEVNQSTSGIASTVASALEGSLKAMGSSGEVARQVIGADLQQAKTELGVGSVPSAQPGESLSKSVVKAPKKDEKSDDAEALMNELIGTGVPSTSGNARMDNMRGALSNIVKAFVDISQLDFKSGKRKTTTTGGQPDDSAGPIDTDGIEAASGSVVDKGVSIAKKFMTNLSMTKEAAAAIAGNFAHESGGFIPGIREGGPFGKSSKPWPQGTVGRGYGWAQWTNSRPGDRYDKFIQSYGGDYNKVPTNEDNFKFAVQEMKTTNKLTDNFKKMTDVSSATVWFRKNWERAGVHHDEPRISYAKGILAKMKKGGKLMKPRYSRMGMGEPSLEKYEEIPEDKNIKTLKGFAKGGVLSTNGAVSDLKLSPSTPFKEYRKHHNKPDTDSYNNSRLGGPPVVPRDYVVVRDFGNQSLDRGAPVVAGIEGKVVTAGGSYNTVIIAGKDGKKRMQFHHFDSITTSVGKAVQASTIIGKQGNKPSGSVHVHLDASPSDHRAWAATQLGGEFDASSMSESGSTGSSGADADSSGGDYEEEEPEKSREEQISDLINKIAGDIVKLNTGASPESTPATTSSAGTKPSPGASPKMQPGSTQTNPPGALAPGQRPDKALNKEQFQAAQKARAEGKAAGLSGKELESYVANAVMGVPQKPAAQLAPTPSATTTGTTVNQMSTTAAAMEEQAESSRTTVPVPVPINSGGSGMIPQPPPQVVRPKTPITYGF